MSRWVYWVSLVAIAVVIAFPAVRLSTDPQARFSDIFKLGIDLAGGTSLVYDLHSPDPAAGPPDADAAKKVIMARIDPSGTRGYIVRAIGTHRLEIVLPGRATRVEAKPEPVTAELLAASEKAAVEQKNPEIASILESKSKAFLGGTMLRVRMNPPLYFTDIQDRLNRAVFERMPDQAGNVAIVGLVPSADQWTEVGVFVTAPASEAKAMDSWVKLATSSLSAQRDVTEVKRLVRQAGFLEFRIVANRERDRNVDFDTLVRAKQTGQPFDTALWAWYPMKDGWDLYAGKRGNLLDAWKYVYVVDKDTKTVQVLVKVDDNANVTGSDLARAYPTTGEGGEPVVGFTMKPEASARFAKLTNPENLQRHMAIILDGTIQSAPALQATLSSNGIITGIPEQQQREELIRVLNSGKLAASLGDPVTERTVGPELGEDNIRHGLWASLIGFLVVVVFMAVYYLFAGLVADMALILNLVLTICIMFWIRQTWTLPGIAGLILALAMAVDANVLIYERLREEKGKEGSLGFALKRAYARAFTTIFDSNITTVIPAIVLLMGLATEEVKGFALVMVIGIGVSMFTAIVVTRMVFETGIKWGLVKKMTMLHFFEKPNIDWMKFAKFAFVSTAALSLAGVVLFMARGDEKYDIEFVGGTQVELALDQAALAKVTEQQFPGTSKDLLPTKFIEVVRAMVVKSVSPAATVQELEYAGETEGAPLSRFLVSVPATGAPVSAETAATGAASGNEQAVKAAVSAAFAGMQPKGAEIRVDVAAAPVTLEMLRQRLGVAPAAIPAATSTAAAPAVTSTAAAPAVTSTAASTQAPAAEYIPDDLRQFLGKVSLKVQLSTPMTLEEARRRIDLAVRELHPDLVTIPMKYEIGQVVEGTGAMKSFDLWVRDDFAGLRAETPDPKFWSDIVSGALAKQETFASTTSFEPTMAGEAWDKAVIAILVSLAAMAVYIWFRFAKFSSGIAAVVATIHDVLVTLGAVTVASLLSGLWTGNWLMLTDMKVNLPLIGAFLTLVGYSVNDTIVVFDRIRENRGKYGDLSTTIINNSINQTLSRTVLTSSTVFLAVIALYFFGGKTSSIHGLAFVMLVGTIIGCYSSIAIASPILVMVDYMKRVYAWSYPILGALLLVYFACVWMKPEAFFARPVALVAAVLAVGWIVVTTWGSICIAYNRPWTLYGAAPVLVKIVTGLSLLAPVVTVILFAAAVIASKASGAAAWAGPGAAAALATCPATYMFYRLVWGKRKQQNS